MNVLVYFAWNPQTYQMQSPEFPDKLVLKPESIIFKSYIASNFPINHLEFAKCPEYVFV